MTRFSGSRTFQTAGTLGVLTALTVLTASCGGGQANTAATGASTSAATTTSPSTAGLGAAPAASLPTVPYTYGDLLLRAWATGDRTAAARYATPDAILALFNHKPIAQLVNFECGDEDPVMCGWIGAGDAQVVLSLNKKRLVKGAPQAVVAAKVTTG